MAAKFFKSFFPTVKAEDDAELVNPQEVLRVSEIEIICVVENEIWNLTLFPFRYKCRRNVARAVTLKVYLPNTKHATIVSTPNHKHRRHV